MDLLSIWYSVVDEGQSDVRYQPSDTQLEDWLDCYGQDIAEEGLRRGMRNFLKKNTQVVTQADALYMNNHINATMRNIKTSIAPIKSDQRPRLKTAD